MEQESCRTMSRRGLGEGTIKKRTDGRFEARLLSPHVDGRTVRKSVYGQTRKEVQARLSQLQQARRDGVLAVSERATTGEFLRMWLETFAARRLKPRTLEGYRDHVERHIIPCLGTSPLSKLTGQAIQQWVNAKATRLSPLTVGYMFAVLRAALRKGRKLGLLSSDPTVAVELPRATKRVPRFLAPDEARRLITAAGYFRAGAVFSITLGLGLRIGEALALRWSDLKLTDGGGSVAIARTLHRMKGGGTIFGEPKSGASRRKLPLPPFVSAILREHQARQFTEREIAGGEWQEGDLVFCTPIGTPLDYSNVRREFHAVLKAAALPMMRIHDLRHTGASLLVSQGVHLKVIQDMLGHSQISLTADTYSHVGEPQRRESAHQMQAVLVLPDPPTSDAVGVRIGVKSAADGLVDAELMNLLGKVVSPDGIEPSTNRLRDKVRPLFSAFQLSSNSL
jgi:integrase